MNVPERGHHLVEGAFLGVRQVVRRGAGREPVVLDVLNHNSQVVVHLLQRVPLLLPQVRVVREREGDVPRLLASVDGASPMPVVPGIGASVTSRRRTIVSMESSWAPILPTASRVAALTSRVAALTRRNPQSVNPKPMRVTASRDDGRHVGPLVAERHEPRFIAVCEEEEMAQQATFLAADSRCRSLSPSIVTADGSSRKTALPEYNGLRRYPHANRIADWKQRFCRAIVSKSAPRNCRKA